MVHDYKRMWLDEMGSHLWVIYLYKPRIPLKAPHAPTVLVQN